MNECDNGDGGHHRYDGHEGHDSKWTIACYMSGGGQLVHLKQYDSFEEGQCGVTSFMHLIADAPLDSRLAFVQFDKYMWINIDAILSVNLFNGNMGPRVDTVNKMEGDIVGYM